ncbi:MAG: Imm72 family immunity protein [Fibrobacterota bacterium]|nr:Imm72 family immunity protein [Fibrobacterota bacterium]
MRGKKTRVPLKDGDYTPDYETLRKTAWLLYRHTSVTYIARMTEMLAGFAKGFNAYLAKDDDPDILGDYLSGCYACLDELNRGMAKLRKADPTGFRLIRLGLSFRDTFDRAMWEYNFEPLGFYGSAKPSRGLWLWMEGAMAMSLKIGGGLCGRLSYPLFDVSKYAFPAQIGGYPLSKEIFIKSGDDIPFTGIWQPISLKGGCPNFLLRGEKAPKAKIPILRIDTAAWVENLGEGLGVKQRAAHSDFDMAEFPTVWQLIEEDERWKNGREPLGEFEYVADPLTQFPKEPPVALEDPPKDDLLD